MEKTRGTRLRNVVNRSQTRFIKKTGRTRAQIPRHLVRTGSFTILMVNPVVFKKTARLRTCPHTTAGTGSPADRYMEDE